MSVALYLGEIEAIPAEVVCTSTNPHLDLVLGTGGAIREAGGEVIQDECRAVIAREYDRTARRYLPRGTAVRTTAGRLPFRAVIHCVAIDAFHGSTPETIAACVRNALREAAALNPPAASIAMPVFASGNGRFDFEKGLNIMLDELARPENLVPPNVVLFTRDSDRADLARRVLNIRFGNLEQSMSALCSAILSALALIQTASGQTAPAQPKPKDALRVLTWNIHGGAAGLDPVVNELRRHNADIICLQEAELGTEDTEESNQPRFIARKLGLHGFSAGSTPGKEGGLQQMAILVRQPLEKTEGLDARTGRTYGITGIAHVNALSVRVVCVHLTNRYRRHTGVVLKPSDVQVQEAADLARRLKDWKEPLILAGDFNAIPVMREHELIGSQLAHVPGTQPSNPPEKSALAIGHVYYSAGLRPLKFSTPQSNASDYRPLLADLLPRPAQSRPHPE